MTKNDLIASRNAAGSAYAAAAALYLETWVALHALDLAGGNGHVAVSSHVPGFVGIPEVMAHSEFLRDVAQLHNRLVDRAHEKHVAILATIS